MRTFTAIDYSVDPGAHAAVITLDRPDRRNAFTLTMCLELLEAFDRAESDDSVRSIVLTGAGTAFCVGADLDEGFVTGDDDVSRRFVETVGRIEGVPRDGGGVASLRIAQSTRPVIVAVNGDAVGVGATMPLPADVRIASPSSRFGFVFARRGLVPEAASSWFLPRVVGVSNAMEWIATGRLVAADEAAARGLVSRVADDPLAEALQLSAEIAESTAPLGVAMSRHLLWSMLEAPSPWDAHRLDTLAIAHLVDGDDVAEGVASFREHRRPHFTTSADQIPDFITRFARDPRADDARSAGR